MTDKPLYYNIATIRKLLLRAFDAEELRRFSLDRPQFRPVVDDFGPKYSLNDMVDEMIEYCWKQNLWDELLTEVKEASPKQYARFESGLMTADVPPDLQLGFREPEPGFPWRRVAIVAAVLAIALILLGVAAGPRLREAACGPLGCKPEGVQRLAIGDFENLTPDATELGRVWTQGTREVLIEKLSQVPSLQLINQTSPQVTDRVKRELDYWIEGQFQMLDRAELRSRLTGPGGRYLAPDVSVEGAPSETLANITALRNELALALLSRLGVEPEPALAETLRNTPTGDMEALALNNEGVDLINLGDYAAAEIKFRAALSLDPDYSIAHSNLAFVLASQGAYDGAITSYQAAIEQLPRYAVFRYNLGNLYLLLERTDEALLSLQEAIRLDPGYVQACNELGNVYILREQWAEAREALEKGLALDPSFAPLHKNLARVALAEGKAGEAIDLLGTALQLYQEKPLEATYLLAEAYAQAGQEAKACQQLAAYWVLDPNRIGEWSLDAEELQNQLDCP